MTTTQFLADMEARGFTVRRDGVRLGIQPAAGVTDSMRAVARELADGILAVLELRDHSETRRLGPWYQPDDRHLDLWRFAQEVSGERLTPGGRTATVVSPQFRTKKEQSGPQAVSAVEVTPCK